MGEHLHNKPPVPQRIAAERSVNPLDSSSIKSALITRRINPAQAIDICHTAETSTNMLLAGEVALGTARSLEPGENERWFESAIHDLEMAKDLAQIKRSDVTARQRDRGVLLKASTELEQIPNYAAISGERLPDHDTAQSAYITTLREAKKVFDAGGHRPYANLFIETTTLLLLQRYALQSNITSEWFPVRSGFFDNEFAPYKDRHHVEVFTPGDDQSIEQSYRLHVISKLDRPGKVKSMVDSGIIPLHVKPIFSPTLGPTHSTLGIMYDCFQETFEGNSRVVASLNAITADLLDKIDEPYQSGRIK